MQIIDAVKHYTQVPSALVLAHLTILEFQKLSVILPQIHFHLLLRDSTYRICNSFMPIYYHDTMSLILPE